MASSKVMASTSPTNQEMPRQPSLSTLLVDLQQQNNTNPNTNSINTNNNDLSLSQTLAPSMSMDDLLKSIYPEASSAPNHELSPFNGGGASISREGSFSLPKDMGNKSVDEVWKEIVAGSSGGGGVGGGGSGAGPEMTLEDFLTKAGAVREEDVTIINSNNNNNNNNINSNNENVVINSGSDRVGLGVGNYGVDAYNSQVAVAVIGNGSNNCNSGGGGGGGGGGDGRAMVVVCPGASGGGGGRGKRRAVEEPPLDKATQQKQRRMIKNRESAARSRERKQAYTVELESLVTQLEEENARLLREEAEENKKRFKQLMENLIPVVEKRRPPRALRRVNSMQW